jgi:hypothetical protein
MKPSGFRYAIVDFDAEDVPDAVQEAALTADLTCFHCAKHDFRVDGSGASHARM